MKDIYDETIFDDINLSIKDEILKDSKDLIFLSQIKSTKIKDVFVGRIVKTSKDSIFKLNDKGYFHRSAAGSAKFNPAVAYTYYNECFPIIDHFIKTENITNVKLPVKYYIDKRIYENEKKKSLDYVWIFALNRVEYYRDPKRMRGKPFGRVKALEKVSDELQLDITQLTNHFNARCQCVRWAKKDFENA